MFASLWGVESLDKNMGDFPGAPVAKNPPSSVGDVGLIPDRATKPAVATTEARVLYSRAPPIHQQKAPPRAAAKTQHSRLYTRGFPGGAAVRPRLPVQGMQVQHLDREDPLEEEMASHSSILARRSLQTGASKAVVHQVAESQT